MHLEKFQVDKIKNGRISAIIHLQATTVKMALGALISSKFSKGSITAGPLLSEPDHFYFASAGLSSTGLILQSITKTAQDSYTITIKQILRFQERMHFNSIKFKKVAYRPLFAFTWPKFGKSC